MRKMLLLILLLNGSFLYAQNILDNEEIQDKTERCLYATYGLHFTEARNLQKELEHQLPKHPAPYFLKGLIIYWQYFPILPEDKHVLDFEQAMDKAVRLSEEMLSKNPGSLEGIFFDMHARAFKAMFWADNGKSGKVISDLDNMYRQTMKGIDNKYRFHEFFFSSGLYNYYIEAYVDNHPVYKPVALLFKKGDKTKGLMELEYAIESTIYIKYESLRFMSLVQLYYENDLENALEYIEILYKSFPENNYYLGLYLIILLHNKDYFLAESLNSKLQNSQNDFDKVIYHMSSGFLQECYYNNADKAKQHYRQALALTEQLGNITYLYSAISEAGLSRIAARNGNEKGAKKHRKRSEDYAKYEFIQKFRR